MKIESIKLKNYRAHESLSVDFQPGFNLVVGVNGSGKTSLLNAIREALSSLPLNLHARSGFVALNEQDAAYSRTESINGRIRFEPQYPVDVSIVGTIFDRRVNWGVEKPNQVSMVDFTGLQPFQVLSEVQKTRQDAEIPFPLIAFYRAGRQWNGARPSDIQAATQKTSRVDAYANWADASLDVSAFQGWVIAKCLERFQTSSETGVSFDQIKDDELALVSGALSEAVEGFAGMKYDLKQKSLLIDWRTNPASPKLSVSFENLSDGQRAVICLVADVARRMCLLNPVLGDEVVKKTAGVVLIDELDIHLHPRWQRILTRGLKRAFPSIQFIAASHSPQVIGELHPEEIILLRQGETSHPQVSYGLSSSQVLEEIMGAGARSTEVELRLGTLFESLERNQFDAAREQLDSLKNDVPGIPELAGAEALLRRKQVLGR